jgi:hypothetical protein
MTSIFNHVAMALVFAVLASVLMPYLDVGQAATWLAVKRHMVAQDVVARATIPMQISLHSQFFSLQTGNGQSKDGLVLLHCVRLC